MENHPKKRNMGATALRAARKHVNTIYANIPSTENHWSLNQTRLNITENGVSQTLDPRATQYPFADGLFSKAGRSDHLNATVVDTIPLE